MYCEANHTTAITLQEQKILYRISLAMPVPHKLLKQKARFEIITAVTMKITAVWDVTPYSLAKSYRLHLLACWF
jgi:hypothetical protein